MFWRDSLAHLDAHCFDAVHFGIRDGQRAILKFSADHHHEIPWARDPLPGPGLIAQGGEPTKSFSSRADVGAHGLAHGQLANPLALLMEMVEE